MEKFVLHDGTPVAFEQIKYAYDHGRAILVHYRVANGLGVGLLLDGSHFDGRNCGLSIWDEQWTSTPSTLYVALEAARLN